MSEMEVTILGCGSSGGVPRIGGPDGAGDWGACDPADPRNRRTRASVLVESGGTHILVDTSPDMREQLLAAEVGNLDAVLWTHEHADHTHGIDDLRVLALNNRKRVDVYFSHEAGQHIVSAFAYCFTAPPGSGYPPILNQNLITAGKPVTISGPGGDIEVLPFRQEHGEISSLGFRIGNFAYSCDLSGIPAESELALRDLDLWVLDALRPTPHPSHLSLPQALEAIERFRPRQAILTNLHIDLDYDQTEGLTPAHVHPAYDGLKIDVTGGKFTTSR